MGKKEIEKILITSVKKYGVDNRSSDLIKRSICCKEIEGVTFEHFRALLLSSGKIVEENTGERYYIALVAPSINKAVVVGQETKTGMLTMAYAKEGLFNQHTAKKAIQILENKA